MRVVDATVTRSWVKMNLIKVEENAHLVHNSAAIPATRQCPNHKLFHSFPSARILHDIDKLRSQTLRSRRTKQQSKHSRLRAAFHNLHALPTNLKSGKRRFTISFIFHWEIERSKLRKRSSDDYYSRVYDRFIAIIKRWAGVEAIKPFRAHERLGFVT